MSSYQVGIMTVCSCEDGRQLYWHFVGKNVIVTAKKTDIWWRVAGDQKPKKLHQSPDLLTVFVFSNK